MKINQSEKAKKGILTLKFLGETTSLPEELLEVRLAIQDSIHRGIIAYLHKQDAIYQISASSSSHYDFHVNYIFQIAKNK